MHRTETYLIRAISALSTGTNGATIQFTNMICADTIFMNIDILQNKLVLSHKIFLLYSKAEIYYPSQLWVGFKLSSFLVSEANI